jgi:signal transduction histidine kinase
MFGMNPGSFGQNFETFLECILPEDRKRIAPEVSAAIKKCLGFTVEYRIAQPDGSIRWMTEDAQVFNDSEGKPTRLVGTVRDITEPKKAQEAIRRQTELLDSIRRAQTLYITEDDPKDVFDTLLETLVKITGSEYGFLDEVCRDGDGRLFKKSLALSNISWDEESGQLYEKLRTSDMEFRDLDNLSGAPARTGELMISNNPAHDPRSGGVPKGHPAIRSFMGIPMYFGGELLGVAGVANRKGGYDEQMASFLGTFISTCAGVIHAVRENRREQQMAEALQEKAGLQQILLDSMPCVALLLRPHTHEIVASNKTAAEVGAIPGKTCYQTWAKTDSPCPWCLAPTAWATGQAQHLELFGGGRFWDAHWIPISEDLYMHYAFDITERKKAEEELMQYQTQLRSLVSQLATTEERKRKEIEAAIHDDLLQKLALCKMRLDELSKSETLKDHANTLNGIAESIREMIRSTRSLTFDLTSPVLYDIGLEAAIRDWLDREVRGKYDIVFEFEDDGRPRQLGNDLRVMLYRAVRELCTNIIKHSRAERATVSIRNQGDDVEIVVEDDGIGMEDQNDGNDPGNFSHRGGLGLFGTRERLDHFGARMKIDSEAGVGTRISIIVPLRCQETLEGTRN